MEVTKESKENRELFLSEITNSINSSSPEHLQKIMIMLLADISYSLKSISKILEGK